MRTVLVAGLTAFAVGCAQKQETSYPANTAHSITDFDRLQGNWAVVKMDSGQVLEDFPPEEVAREMERMKQGRFHFDHESLTMNLLGQRDRFSFSLDESREPKAMVLTTTGEVGRENEKLEWIYKFEEDVLVLAFMKGGQRPTEFKARRQAEGNHDRPEVRGIHVIWLQKTVEPSKRDVESGRQSKSPRGSTPK